MKKFFTLMIAAFFSISMLNQKASAYSYGDPGEEALAEAYKEFAKDIDAENWEEAEKVYQAYEKEFDLYFKPVQPSIEKGLKEKDKELALASYQAALRLNVERRLQYTAKEFDNYGQAKLLLAKARGTFNVLEPIMTEKEGKEKTEKIYQSFESALKSLGNPGLFGIGQAKSDKTAFDKETKYIVDELESAFPLPAEKKKNEFAEEEGGILSFAKDKGSDFIWMTISVSLVVIFIILVVVGKMRKKKRE